MSNREERCQYCGNCHAYLEPDDKYCRICGTKAGMGAFKPHLEIMQCIYGPEPVDRIHICKRCGYTWKTCLMIDKEKYCPKCGGAAPYNGNDSDEDTEQHILRQQKMGFDFWNEKRERND